MDIDKMQKINKLARELLQHGVVSDMEEATKQAENMVNKDDNGISDVMHLQKSTSSAVQTSTQYKTVLSSSNPNEASSIAPQQEGHDYTMELRKLAYALQDQSKTISSLKQQLDTLRDEMSKLKMRPMQQPAQAPIVRGGGTDSQAHVNPPTNQIKRGEASAEHHPKVGEYNPDNISVEKFFYSGPSR